MSNVKPFIRNMGAFLALLVFLVGSPVVSAQDEPQPSDGKSERLLFLSEDCGPDQIEKPASSKAGTWSALKQELYAARTAGDEERVRELEAGLPKAPAVGESAGGAVTTPSTTVWGPGDFKDALKGGFGSHLLTKEQKAAFGDDVQVRNPDLSTTEVSQTMASDSAGNLYVAWEDAGIIQIYWSTDDGTTWNAFAYLANPDAYLKDPCLAVGEGNADLLLVAYVADVYLAEPKPEVSVSPLSSPSFTIRAVPYWNWWESYAKPVIWTDDEDFPGWYAYLTCEGIFDSATDNYNICTWRSTDQGVTWTNETVSLGNSDDDAWIDPDGSYGTPDQNSYVVCYNDTDDTIYTILSDTYGLGYDPEVAVYTMTTEPSYPVEPEIEAALNEDNVMICCTRYSVVTNSDNIGQIYSLDAGDTWTGIHNVNGYTAAHEMAPALTTDRHGACWHLTYTIADEHRVMYNQRPQDLTDAWFFYPIEVDDDEHASATYPKKGIACSDEGICGIAWADYRDGSPDYDTFFDISNIVRVPNLYTTIQDAIDAAVDGYTIMVSPGSYVENIDFLGKTITVKGTRGAKKTKIDGNQAGCVVTFNSLEDYKTRLDGFTILNGDGFMGGGIFCDHASPVVINCIIRQNEAVAGGGIYVAYSDAFFHHCTVYDNHAEKGGGGLYSYQNLSYEPMLMSTILWNNTAASGEAEVGMGTNGYLFVMCSDIKGGWTGAGSGNIDQDPLFVDAANNDFHLTWLSPCINRAATCTLGPFYDFENDPRPIMGKEDMGVDEYTGIHTLEADNFTISETSGGTVNFTLNGAKGTEYRNYMIFGGITGTNPGTPLPGGYAILPVNWDVFTNMVIDLINTPIFLDFMGTLDGNCTATAQLNLPPVPGAASLFMRFAYALNNKWDFVSNPIVVGIE